MERGHIVRVWTEGARSGLDDGQRAAALLARAGRTTMEAGRQGRPRDEVSRPVRLADLPLLMREVVGPRRHGAGRSRRIEVHHGGWTTA